MTSSFEVPSFTRTALAVVATLAVAAGVSALATNAANAATETCAGDCISVFSSELGTYEDPNFVEAILGDGAAEVGQPVGLKAASNSDPTEDILPLLAPVSHFHGLGIVSDEANEHYASNIGVQQQYAPFGDGTGLCVGLAEVKQNVGLTLQPCDAATTVWVIDAYESSPEGYFPIINAATTDHDSPFAMHLPRDAVAADKPLQMRARRLQFREDGTLRARQLWGAVDGVLTP